MCCDLLLIRFITQFIDFRSMLSDSAAMFHERVSEPFNIQFYVVRCC